MHIVVGLHLICKEKIQNKKENGSENQSQSSWGFPSTGLPVYHGSGWASMSSVGWVSKRNPTENCSLYRRVRVTAAMCLSSSPLTAGDQSWQWLGNNPPGPCFSVGSLSLKPKEQRRDWFVTCDKRFKPNPHRWLQRNMHYRVLYNPWADVTVRAYFLEDFMQIQNLRMST